MVELEIILLGLGDAFSLQNFIFIIMGVVIGQFVGAVPGIGPIMATAIAIPFTFVLDLFFWKKHERGSYSNVLMRGLQP